MASRRISTLQRHLLSSTAADNVGESETLDLFVLQTVLPSTTHQYRIFEPRYVAMVERALSNDRTFGMVAQSESGVAESFGCKLRITEYERTSDGGFSITVSAENRFHVLETVQERSKESAQVAVVQIFTDKFSDPASVEEEDRGFAMAQAAYASLHSAASAVVKTWRERSGDSKKSDDPSPTAVFVSARIVAGCSELSELQQLDKTSWTWRVLSSLPIGPELQLRVLRSQSLKERIAFVAQCVARTEEVAGETRSEESDEID